MSKKNLVKPQKDIEYTFIFPDGKLHTLRYYGENDKSKYIFYNVKTKKFVAPMTPRRFDYMYERQLQSAHIGGAFSVQKDITKKENEYQSESVNDRNIKLLSMLTGPKKVEVEHKFGKPIKDIISEYQEAIKTGNLAHVTEFRYACISMGITATEYAV